MTPTLKKKLRAQAHSLKPVVMVGDAGLSDAVIAEANRALTDHELIKVRLSGADRDERDQMATLLCEQLRADQIQSIGHIRVLFRENPPQAEMPVKSKRKKPKPKRSNR